MKKLVSLLVIATCAFTVSCSPKISSPSSTPTANAGSNPSGQIITLAKYNQITVGMPLAQVNTIFGGVSPKKETLNMSGLVSTVYQYKNPDGKSWVNISVDTSDNVTFTTQFGLK